MKKGATIFVTPDSIFISSRNRIIQIKLFFSLLFLFHNLLTILPLFSPIFNFVLDSIVHYRNLSGVMLLRITEVLGMRLRLDVNLA